MGCRKIFQLGSLIITLLIVFSIYVAIFKPDFVIDPIKSFLNYPYGNELEKHTNKKVDINQKISESEGSIILDEDEVYNLINDKFPQAKISRIELEEGKLIAFRNIASNGKPLWLSAEVELKEEKYQIGRVGLGRLEVPQAFKDQTINWIIEKIGSTDMKPDLSKFMGEELGLLLDPKYLIIKENQVEIEIVDIDTDKFKDIFDSIDPQQYKDGLDKTVEGVTKILNTK